MAEQTKIRWADSTVNWWSGCTKVSPGCANCYAEARDARMMQEKVIHWGKGAPRLKHVGAVKQALAMNRKPWICDDCGEAHGAVPDCCGAELFEGDGDQRKSIGFCVNMNFHRRRVFSLSLGDWLDDEVPVEWLAEMLDTIRQCDQVVWILCTKRPENFFSRLSKIPYDTKGVLEGMVFHGWLCAWLDGFEPQNIILLTSVENQAADNRITDLLKIPAVCHGLSLEPLLGPVLVGPLGNAKSGCSNINWIIIGGESGPNARPCKVDWIRSLVEQGEAAGVETFVKQLGSNAVYGELSPKCFRGEKLELDHSKGGDPDEWPLDLQVQQWPDGF